MARILVTSARAPVALELIRNFGKHGHYVITTDSLSCPLGFNSKYLAEKIKTPSPRFSFYEYQMRIIEIVDEFDIDTIVPTCEEIFYLSQIENESIQAKLFSPDHRLLRMMHSKIDLLKMVEGLGIKTPETKVSMIDDLCKLSDRLSTSIVKPEYSRFGNRLLIKPNDTQVIDYTKRTTENNSPRGMKYLVQDFIEGKEICSYSLVVEGEVMATTLYSPKYRVAGSAIYFEPEQCEQAESFIAELAKKYNITGQISFDFIEKEDELYLIECNPRSTSGLHFLKEADIYSLIKGQKLYTLDCKPKMLRLAMQLFRFSQSEIELKSKEWLKAYRVGEDILRDKEDRNLWLYQMRSYGELKRLSIKENISISEATTWDIEWNGEEM